MKTLVQLSGAVAGVMVILVGSMLPAGFLFPSLGNPLQIFDLPSTWQAPSLMLTALLCGPRTAVIAAIAYLTIGIFFLPIFQNGGSINYLNDPSFGYLMGFIPAAWITGKLAKQNGMNNLILLTFSAMVGIIVMQAFGVINLIFGTLLNKWGIPLPQMLFSYTIAPIIGQIILCPAIGILAFSLRGLLFIE